MTRIEAARSGVRVLELRSVWGTGGGPEKTILLGAAATDPRRAAITVCYLRDSRDDLFQVNQRAASLGVDYVELIERHSLDPSIPGRLERLVRERAIDVIHSHEYKTDALAWWVARRAHVGLLSTAHGWTGHSPRERYLYHPANKRLLAWFPTVVAVSSEIRRQLLNAGARPERVRVLLNGIDHTIFARDPTLRPAARARLGRLETDVIVGLVGRLEPQKRFDVLVDACAEVRRAIPELYLVIAGEGSQRAVLERHIAKGGHEGWCRLLGQVDDVKELHHALDLFVQSSMYEGTPNVILEAMALETPIVATDVGGTAEICRPGIDGLIVPPERRDALATAISCALGDADARNARVRSARARVETDLSFRTRVRALEDIYQELRPCAPR